jgi:glycosyltransferase involved in cell wall biosynthesis
VRALGVVGDSVVDVALQVCDVAVNPMRYGSGTNLKMLHYLAAGIPVLTSRCGCRGLDLRDGEHLAIAEPEDFAAALENVLAEPAAAGARSRRARAVMEERFDWRLVAHRLAVELE